MKTSTSECGLVVGGELTSRTYFMAALRIWVRRAWLIGFVCHRHRYLLKTETRNRWGYVQVNILPETVFNRTTYCLHVAQRHALAISINKKIPKRIWIEGWYVVAQQSRRIIKSSVISNQETHMMYGKMDVVENWKGRKRKWSSKILDLIFYRRQAHC